MSDAPPIIGVVGPTASGKTDLALALARHLRVEIIVADSRQVYRGMAIGTAAPDATARAAVPHHLVGIVRPDEPFTVVDWVERARPLVDEIAGRGRVPMLVGGTGLYVSALLDGHDYAAQAHAPERRAALEEELAAGGLPSLAERLQRAAPDVAAAIDLHNPRRVLRALERASVGDASVPRSDPYPEAAALVAVDRPREVLARRIDERAARLFTTGGLLDEVRALLDAGFGPELRPMSGHGYHEAIGHLRGALTIEAAIESTARRTRQYAKRQLTWFRRDPRVRWLPAGEEPGDAPPLVEAARAALEPVLS